MKNKKMILLFIGVLIIILLSIYFIIKNFKSDISTEQNEFSEYTPEEEISYTQMRETTVALYYLDLNSNKIKSECKHIDSISLLENPYKKLIELLLEGPQSNNLINVFPDNTQILDATIENNCVTLNFTDALINFNDEIQKYNIINCLLNTLNQLNEVDSFKILINNELSDVFTDEYKTIHN